MSKLDELDLEISEYARSFSAPYAIEVDANALENEIKELARKYYNLGKLEEREVMKRMVAGKIIKQSGEPTLKKPRLITYEEVETHNALIGDILNELNQN